MCIWISPHVKRAVGFETHYDRYKRAKVAVERSGAKNVEIKYADFSRASFRKATVIYSIVDIGLGVMSKINRESARGTKVIQYLRPNYPLMGTKLFGDYFLLKTPFKRARDEDEYARAILGRESASMKDLARKLGGRDMKHLKKEIEDSKASWNRLFR